ncbi:MAG TPA: FliM/FliN family flagellar motor switch protein, partial [Burkholderiaceae bacterium]
LDRAPVRLQVRLEPVEIDLGSLAALAVGDVLCLTHAVDEPARIVPPSAAADAPVLCHGWLGRRDDRAAVELVRRPAGPAAIR